MNTTASPLADGALTLEQLRALGIKPQDINTEWMDQMVDRLFVELKRELSQLENAKPIAGDDQKGASARNANARTLHSLEVTLERLETLKAQRATKEFKKPGAARAEIERSILAVAEQAAAQGSAGESER